MSPQNEPSAGASREQARARLRNLTRVALFATTGATVGIGILVAHEHPGKSGASTTSGRSTGGTASSGSTGSTGNSGSSSTSTSGNTGNTGASSLAPSTSSQSPSVTSGGTSR